MLAKRAARVARSEHGFAGVPRARNAVSTRGRHSTPTHWGHQNNLSSYNGDLPIKRAVFTPGQSRTRKGLAGQLHLRKFIRKKAAPIRNATAR